MSTPSTMVTMQESACLASVVESHKVLEPSRESVHLPGEHDVDSAALDRIQQPFECRPCDVTERRDVDVLEDFSDVPTSAFGEGEAVVALPCGGLLFPVLVIADPQID